MQGTPVIAKLEAVEKIDRSTALAAKRIFFPNNTSQKPAFSELVERAHNEMLEKQKVDKIQSADEKRFESREDEKVHNSEVDRTKKIQSDTSESKERIIQNDDMRDANNIDAEKFAAVQVMYHDEAQNALLENIAAVIEGVQGSEEFELSQRAQILESATAFVPQSAAAVQLNEQPVFADADIQSAEDYHISDSFAERQHALDADGKIIVTDLRTEVEIEAVKPVKNAETELLVSTDKNGTPQLVMTLGQNIEQNILSLDNQSASAASSNFQAMLTNQIQANAGEFVKAGSIVLRDNNMGTINLVLHPESLGNVKISLQLSDKVINGQIVVSTQEAYNAFKDSADVLRNAFSQNGFEANAFTVAYSGAHGGSGNFTGAQGDDSYAYAQGGSSYENAQLLEAIPSGNTYITAEHAVNVVA